uniref:Uncharacterized protein n=1 Tax=Chromera velia CCMP2878 TaxID=1169474 RepID=A0A0G4H5T1_9ALVE|mmetsp:Transcript_14428/g.29040  ORF Transcript_14428/g.29040 Transcript_14428/m.29040 type:complete len:395 (-) Transcript_14428:99-1283(-)|eukprot:Cvel_5731.t1-p1 / transcript=Cvel_5731.t1 / gene=Cvel_5731 / organism=Chromera_velia_CCMP2878 / gene_product=CUGBP Elav-like family member 3-A, putative / transcript_product=CUGBP Elav-like family member 3-A, putative / location=Cvel_scaffold271:101655-105147(+) / protein_length=394 / sequence_SO=supercontig / SO=protein_coding / is_pseudo=false
MIGGAAPQTNAAKVFLGSIPRTVNEGMIREEAQKFGTIDNIFYKPDEGESGERGWAFVSYVSPEMAQAAIQGMDSKLTFPGAQRACEARLANSGGKRMGGATGYGPAVPNPVAKAASSIWQTYHTPEGHPYYYNTKTQQTQWEKPPELDAPPPVGGGVPMAGGLGAAAGGAGGAGGQTYGPPGANLFVFHIPGEWTDQDLIQHFSPFGNVISARVQKSMETPTRNRGFGFVSFDAVDPAANAIRALNGLAVGGKWLKVQIKKGEEQYGPADVQPGAMKGGGRGGGMAGGGMGGPPGGAMRGGQFGGAPYGGAAPFAAGGTPYGAAGRGMPYGAPYGGAPGATGYMQGAPGGAAAGYMGAPGGFPGAMNGGAAGAGQPGFAMGGGGMPGGRFSPY